jgi:hypothetical protein
VVGPWFALRATFRWLALRTCCMMTIHRLGVGAGHWLAPGDDTNGETGPWGPANNTFKQS